LIVTSVRGVRLADAGWTLYELHLEAGSLEDLFRQLTVTGEAA
jgi:hypothetical protein